MLKLTVRLTLPCDEQDLVRTRPTRRRPRSHLALHHVHRERPLRAVPDLDRRPGGLRQRGAPAVHPQERVLRMRSSPRVLRWWRVEVADQGVRGDRQQVPFAPTPQFQAEIRGTSHLIVACHPGVRQHRAVFLQHLQGQLVAGAERDPPGDPGRLAPPPVLGPLLGEIKTRINESMFFARYISHVHTDLTVLLLAKPAAPLPLHADRSGPFLAKAEGSNTITPSDSPRSVP